MAANLHRLAAMAMARAHAPYSRYNVGAAILTTDGRTFAGCNVENASFPEGWCAETSAIAHMVMDGGGRIAEVAVICDAVDAITPCGGCRQRLSEFGAPGNEDPFVQPGRHHGNGDAGRVAAEILLDG